MKIIIVAGARPNFIKIAPIIKEIKKRKGITCVLVHTGQHYDKNMSGNFFKDLGIPRPNEYLKVGSGSHTVQTANVMIKLEKVIDKHKPDMVMVVGDVNSTLAAALVTAKKGIKLAHIESGLRSRDRSMPEEINRILTDSLADYHFTTCLEAGQNLVQEGVSFKKIFFVGNVMIDTLRQNILKAKKRKILPTLGVKPKKYCVVTLHRPSNVDGKKKLSDICKCLSSISKEVKVIFPVHPRTKKLISSDLDNMATERFKLIEPLGYLDFLKLVMCSAFVVTDSGGIQEETTVLKVPCLTFRENTERPITVTEGSNVLIGTSVKRLGKEINEILTGNLKKSKIPKLWDGKTSIRIVNILMKLKDIQGF